MYLIRARGRFFSASLLNVHALLHVERGRPDATVGPCRLQLAQEKGEGTDERGLFVLLVELSHVEAGHLGHTELIIINSSNFLARGCSNSRSSTGIRSVSSCRLSNVS